jgi:hypothetical protein
MATKTSKTIILTSTQVETLEYISFAGSYGVYLSQDSKKTANRLVQKGLALVFGKNTYRISKAGNRVLSSGKYIQVR